MRKCLLLLLALVCLYTPRAYSQSEEESARPPASNNAALDYLIASALLPRPESPEEVTVCDLLEEKIWELPPEAFADYPDLVEFVKRDLEPGFAIWALHRGSQKANCDFGVDYASGPDTLLPHLKLFRDLARRSLAVANYVEFEGESERAIEIHEDVLRMSVHVAEEPFIISFFIGIWVQDKAISGLEGMLARGVDRDEALKILNCLQGIPDPPFRPEICLRGEERIMCPWFLRHPDRGKKMVMENIEADLPEGQDVEHDLVSKRYESRVKEWRRLLLLYAEAAEGPYYNAAPALEAQRRQLMTRMLQGLDWQREPEKANPMISMHMPAALGVPAKCAGAQARLRMIKLACAAALYKAEESAYPESIRLLARYFPNGVPADPFTGEDFVYRLVDGAPHIESRVPEELKDQLWGRWAISLARRAEDDKEALAEFRRQFREEESVKP